MSDFQLPMVKRIALHGIAHKPLSRGASIYQQTIQRRSRCRKDHDTSSSARVGLLAHRSPFHKPVQSPVKGPPAYRGLNLSANPVIERIVSDAALWRCAESKALLNRSLHLQASLSLVHSNTQIGTD